MEKRNHVASVGFLCQWYQRSFHDLTKALYDAGLKPVLVIDTTMHYDFDEVARVLTQPAMIRGQANV